MTNHILHKCTCPLCKKAGQSVAAMRYAETRHWNKPETFDPDVGFELFGIRFDPDDSSEKYDNAFYAIIAVIYAIIAVIIVVMLGTVNSQQHPIMQILFIDACLLPIMFLLVYTISFIESYENAKRIHRYNQLHYCKNCHLLFDSQGRSADGGEFGFSQMMAYD